MDPSPDKPGQPNFEGTRGDNSFQPISSPDATSQSASSSPGSPLPLRPANSVDPLTVPLAPQASAQTPAGRSGIPTTNEPPPGIYPPSGIYGGSDQSGVQSGQAPKPKKRKLIFALAGFLTVLLIALGVVFGYYLPNKPENVWRTGLERSGDALEELTNKATETQKLEQIKNSEVNGSLEFKSDDYKFNGTLASKLNETRSDSTLDVAFRDADGREQKLNLKALTNLPEGKKYPNVFLQFNGAQELGLAAILPNLAQYEGKWIGIDSEYLESLAAYETDTKTEENQKNITSEEYAQVARTVSATSNEYLFTSDPDKAVLENRGFIAKEEVDGIKTYHYQAAINQQHAQEFCVVLTDRVISLPAWQKLFELDEESTREMKDSTKKDCEEDVKTDPEDDGVFDLWVDAKYKLIYKVRDYLDKEKKSYAEFGQRYNGGDEVSFFIGGHSDETQFDAKLTVSANLKTNATDAELTVSQKADDGFFGVFDAKATFKAKQYDGEISVDEPQGTLKLQDILKSLGLDPSLESARDLDAPISN